MKMKEKFITGSQSDSCDDDIDESSKVVSRIDLASFHCSETVVQDVNYHESTQLEDKNIDLSKYIKTCASPNTLVELEQIVNVQDEVLDMAETMLSELENTVHEIDLNIGRCEIYSEEFDKVMISPPTGFMPSSPFDKQRETMDEIRNIISASKKRIAEGSTRSKLLRKSIWSYRDSQSIINSTGDSLDVSGLLHEVDDIVTDMVPKANSRRRLFCTPRKTQLGDLVNTPPVSITHSHGLANAPMRRLRSHGPVRDLPNVLSSPLEYGTKSIQSNE